MQKLLYKKEQFREYVDMPSTIPDERYNASMRLVQETELVELLSDALIELWVGEYSKSLEIISITAGNPTIVTVVANSTFFILPEATAAFSALSATERQRIISIVSNEITVDFDSTGDSFPALGTVSHIENPRFAALRAQVLPFMALACDMQWQAQGKFHNSVSGYVQKGVSDTSEPADPKALEAYFRQLKSKKELYAKKVQDFLKAAPLVYPEFPENTNRETQSTTYYAVPNKRSISKTLYRQ